MDANERDGRFGALGGDEGTDDAGGTARRNGHALTSAATTERRGVSGTKKRAGVIQRAWGK